MNQYNQYIELDLTFRLATNRQALPAIHQQLIHLARALGKDGVYTTYDSKRANSYPLHLSIPKGRIGGDLVRWFEELYDRTVEMRKTPVVQTGSDPFTPSRLVYDDWHDTAHVTLVFVHPYAHESETLRTVDCERTLAAFGDRLHHHIGATLDLSDCAIRFAYTD